MLSLRSAHEASSVWINERKTGGPLETIPISRNLNFAHTTPIYGRREYMSSYVQLLVPSSEQHLEFPFVDQI